MKFPLYCGDTARLVASLISLFLLSGCAGFTASQFERAIDSQIPKQWHQSPTDETASTDLLSLVPNDQLHRLVEQALSNNPSLQQTALLLKEAQLLSRRAGADRYPQLSTSYNPSRQELPNNIQGDHVLSFNVSWELDLWGRLADQRTSERYNERASAADLQGAQNSLAARVLQAALLVIKSKQEVEIESRRVTTLALNEDIIKLRYRVGLGSLADWQAAGSSLATAESNLLSRKEALAQNMRALSRLLGDIQLQTIQLPDSLPTVNGPIPSLPAQVLAQRPDLVAALNRIQAADRNALASYKSLLPSFSLSGDFAQAGSSSSDMLRADPLWSVLGNLTQPIFQGGRLKAQAESAQFSAERAYWRYQEALLNAVTEIENLFGLQAAIESQQEHLQRAVDFSQANLAEFERRYRNGLVNIVDLLNVQSASFDAEVQLLQNQFDKLNNRIDLALALGLPAMVQ